MPWVDRLARFGVALFVSVAVASGAHSGAWPRDEGTIFFAVGGNVALSDAARRPVHYDPTVYLEYGLTQSLTVGLDGYLADAGDAGSGFAFVRYPLSFGSLGGPDSRNRLAVSLGLGATVLPNAEIDTGLRLSFHFGRGLETGWLSLDADVVRYVEAGQNQTKLSFTWGRDFTERWTAILEGQIGTGLTGDIYAKVTPSFAWHATERLTVRVGATKALTGDRGAGLMVQTWWQF